LGLPKEFIMKRLLLIVLPLLLIIGCSKPINEEILIEKGGLREAGKKKIPQLLEIKEKRD